MRPTIEQVLKAVEAMGAPGMVRYFPNDPTAREMITEELYCMVPTVEALQWLLSAMVRGVGEWGSLKDLRLVLAKKYTPLDADRFPVSPWADGPYLPREFYEPVARSLPPPIEREREAPKLIAAVDAQAPCPRCGNYGLLESPGAKAHWQYCECERGELKRKLEPRAVDEANAAVAKLRRLAVPCGRPIAPVTAQEARHA